MSVLVFIIFSVVFVTDIADCLSDFVHTSDSWHHVVYVCKCTVRDICCVTGNLFFFKLQPDSASIRSHREADPAGRLCKYCL